MPVQATDLADFRQTSPEHAMGEFDLATVIRRAREGEPEAASVLIERLYPLVIRIVRSHLPKRMAEEDLAQDVFLKLLSRLSLYEARAEIPFEHWASRLACRVCLDALRAERRRPELRLSDLTEGEAAWVEYFNAAQDAPPDTSPEEAREIVERLLAQLSPADRLVLSLLDLEQRSVKEISERTGLSMTLVKVRAFRARRKLRLLARQLSEAEK
jgi:RNA polymerase sigma-70 factor, ECF subfamily